MIIRKLLLTLILVGACLPSFSVTKEEMEKARAISAKIYLRWANNGSDYLDNKNPASLAELEKSLKTKEQENIKAFKNIAIPGDYESWDKSKLVEYWSQTALSSAGLNADGTRAGAKSQIKKELSKMSVSAPVVKEESPEATSPTVDSPKAEAEEIPQSVEQLTEVAEDSVIASDSAYANDSLLTPAKKESSSTWIYVTALALLVIAVIALVVYASKNMKKSEVKDEDDDDRNSRFSSSTSQSSTQAAPTTQAAQPAPQPFSVSSPSTDSTGSSDSRMREKYAENLALKQEEIRELTRQLETVTRENSAMSAQVDTLQQEVDRLRSEIGRLQTAGVAPATTPASVTTASANSGMQQSVRPAQPRQIFLGRVNSRGQFVRADRSLNPGNSIYVLETADGVTGSFRVADDPSVAEVSFSRPLEMLSGGCVAMDITDTKGKSGILTETAGTAVFENNIWRVVRKARIRYI